MNTIIHMKHSQIESEYIREVQDEDRRKRLAAKNEADMICLVISKYFTAEKWDAFVDAGPDDAYQWLDYVRNEAAYITTELFDIEEQAAQAKETAEIDEWLSIEEAQSVTYGTADLTAEQINLDLWQKETEATRRTDYPI